MTNRLPNNFADMLRKMLEQQETETEEEAQRRHDTIAASDLGQSLQQEWESYKTQVLMKEYELTDEQLDFARECFKSAALCTCLTILKRSWSKSNGLTRDMDVKEVLRNMIIAFDEIKREAEQL